VSIKVYKYLESIARNGVVTGASQRDIAQGAKLNIHTVALNLRALSNEGCIVSNTSDTRYPSTYRLIFAPEAPKPQGVRPDEITRIVELFREGLSMKQIGDRVGRTKNSVIGIIHRHTNESRPSPIRRKGDEAPPAPRVIRAPQNTLPPLGADVPRYRTQEGQEAAMEAWRRGMSSRQMAAEFGFPSDKAVLEWRKRRGLAPREPTVARWRSKIEYIPPRTGPTALAKRAEYEDRRDEGGEYMRENTVPISRSPPPVVMPHMPSTGACQWIEGDYQRHRQPRWCGEPAAAGYSWCDAHCRRVYVGWLGPRWAA